MQVKDVLTELRTKKGLTQEQLAEKVFVTRQAVSRWENGETVPNTETLKLLSELFGVSINTLLGSPRKLVCQCCGMPMDDSLIGKNADGTFNEDFCKWCYADGTFTYDDMDELTEVCVKHMANERFSEEQAREYMKNLLPQLKYWKNHAQFSDGGEFEKLKEKLIAEINAVKPDGMPCLTSLNALVGSYVNIAYELPSGERVKFLNDGTTYLGNQLEGEDGLCFGVLANAEFIMICRYGEGGKDPELLLYKKRTV